VIAAVPLPVNWVVFPVQADKVPVIVGKAFMPTDVVVLLQEVVVFVKVKVAFPTATPVTIPKLVTVAILLLLLIHVPPVVGESVIVLPIQTDAPAVTTGNAFIVIALVVALQLVVVFKKVKVALPAATPVTTPALFTVAIVLSLLVHVPPVVGNNVIVLPTHIEVVGVLTTGNAFTVTEFVVLLQLVEVFTNVKLALPAAIPVTIPTLLTDALEASLLDHVPPDVGAIIMVLPIHTAAAADTAGNAFTVIEIVLLQLGAVELVKVNVTLPDATPVTTPALVTVAIVISLLDQVPPDVGVTLMVLPRQTDAAEVVTTGNAETVIPPENPVVTVHPVELVITQ